MCLSLEHALTRQTFTDSEFVRTQAPTHTTLENRARSPTRKGSQHTTVPARTIRKREVQRHVEQVSARRGLREGTGSHCGPCRGPEYRGGCGALQPSHGLMLYYMNFTSIKKKSKTNAMSSKKSPAVSMTVKGPAGSLCRPSSRGMGSPDRRPRAGAQAPQTAPPPAGGPGRSFRAHFRSRNHLVAANHVRVIQTVEDTGLVHTDGTELASELASESSSPPRRRSQATGMTGLVGVHTHPAPAHGPQPCPRGAGDHLR